MTPASLASRTVVGLLGGWLFASGVAAFGVAAAVGLGMALKDARLLLNMLAFLVLPAVFLWAFAARRVAWVWAALVGGGATLVGAAAWLAPRVA